MGVAWIIANQMHRAADPEASLRHRFVEDAALRRRAGRIEQCESAEFVVPCRETAAK